MATQISNNDRSKNEKQKEGQSKDAAGKKKEEQAGQVPQAKAKSSKPSQKSTPGTGIVASLREAYITAYLQNPDGVSTEAILATLAKKGIVPGKGTISVQLATVKATLKSLNDRGVLKVK